MKSTRTKPTVTCVRCKHKWHPRNGRQPMKCAGCGSPYWKRPRIRGAYHYYSVTDHRRIKHLRESQGLSFKKIADAMGKGTYEGVRRAFNRMKEGKI